MNLEQNSLQGTLRALKSAPVGVISKLLEILEVLHASPAGLPLRFIVEQTSLNKSTVHRIVSHLEAEGYLFRDDSRAYVPGPMLVRLGCGAMYQMTLRKMARPILRDLRDETGETVNLGILLGRDVGYVDVLQSRNGFGGVSRIGYVRPLYCTAMGKMLAAVMPVNSRERILSSLRFERITPHTITELTKLRAELALAERRGFAVDNEEAVPGTRCVSAAVFIDGNSIAAAISIAGPTGRISENRIDFFVDAVQRAARILSARMNSSDITH